MRKGVNLDMEFFDGRTERERWGELDQAGTDRDIEDQVDILLNSDSDLWNYDLHPQVSNGVISITGIVNVAEDVEKLRNLVNIEGNRGVELNVAVNAEVSNLDPQDTVLEYRNYGSPLMADIYGESEEE